MDYVAFLARYPEFATVDPSTITAILTEVAFGLDATVYLTRLPAAQGALTAHKLWLSPAGVSLRGDSDAKGESDYSLDFKQIRRECTIGFAVIA